MTSPPSIGTLSVLPFEMISQEIRHWLSAADRIRLKRCCKALYEGDPDSQWPAQWKGLGKALLDPCMDNELVDALLKSCLVDWQLLVVYSNRLEFEKCLTFARNGLQLCSVAVGTRTHTAPYLAQIYVAGEGIMSEFKNTIEEVDAWIAQIEKKF